jgi:hypothetical protein
VCVRTQRPGSRRSSRIIWDPGLDAAKSCLGFETGDLEFRSFATSMVRERSSDEISARNQRELMVGSGKQKRASSSGRERRGARVARLMV